MTLVIKRVDERKLREFKAEAVRRGLTLSEAFEEAIELWLSARPLFSEEDANNAAYLREGDVVVFLMEDGKLVLVKSTEF